MLPKLAPSCQIPLALVANENPRLTHPEIDRYRADPVSSAQTNRKPGRAAFRKPAYRNRLPPTRKLSALWPSLVIPRISPTPVYEDKRPLRFAN